MKRLDELRQLAKETLKEKRYIHTLNVEKLGVELAKNYGVDETKVAIACLLHDITKHDDLDEQLQIIKKSDIIVDEVTLKSTNLYHAVTGAIYARDVIGIDDEEIINAILYHTSGSADMGMIEKIVYVADTISYERTYDGVEQLRELAFKDLDETMLEIMDATFKKLIRKRLLIGTKMIECYNDIAYRKQNSDN